MQSYTKIFAGVLLVLSLTFLMFVSLTPKRVSAVQEVCPETGGGWIKVDELSSTTYDYTAPTGKLVSRVCYKASTTVNYLEIDPAQESVKVTSTVLNSNDKVQNLSHASFLLIDKPVVNPYFNLAVCYAENHMARFGYLARDLVLPATHSEWMNPSSYVLPTLPFGTNSDRVWSDELYPTNMGRVL